jgi:para-aminobenzoate synthetase component I
MVVPAADLVAVLAALAPRPVTVVRDGASIIVGVEPDLVVVARGEDAFAALDRAERSGFWTGFLSYDLGRAVEHVTERLPDDLHLPDVVLARHDARIVFTPGASPQVVGRGATRTVLVDALRRAERAPARLTLEPVTARWRSSLTRAEHAQRVHAIKELLDAGECYQVNLTRRLTTYDRVDPVALYAALVAGHRAPFTGFLRVTLAGGPVAVVCASPERFLAWTGL